MKKILLLFTVCALFLCGCSIQSSSLSAKEAMEQYFKYWNDKDREMLLTMEADIGIPKEGYAYNFEIEKVTIESLEVVENPTSLNDEANSEAIRELYENAAEIAEVKIVYDITYPNGQATGTDNSGLNQRVYYLVRLSTDNSWVIASVSSGV